MADSLQETLVLEGEPAATGEKRRSAWKVVLIVLGVLLALVAAAEFALRMLVPGVLTSVVRQALHLPSDASVEVSTGGFVLWNTVTGRVGELQVSAPELELSEGIVVDLQVEAASVPLNVFSGELVDATATAGISSSELGPIVQLVTRGAATTGEIRDDQLVVGREVEILGAQVPLTVSLGLSVVDGELQVEPSEVSVTGMSLSTDELSRLSGGALDGLLSAHAVCVADRMPAGITLTGITLAESAMPGAPAITVTADIAPDLLSNKAQQQKGSCDG